MHYLQPNERLLLVYLVLYGRLTRLAEQQEHLVLLIRHCIKGPRDALQVCDALLPPLDQVQSQHPPPGEIGIAHLPHIQVP